MVDDIKELTVVANRVRRNLLKLAHEEVIHIGGDLSVTDVMTVLLLYQMNYNPEDPKDPNRDRFVLSKGHASAVTSFCQAEIGCFAAQDVINEYATDGGRFSMHSCNKVNPFVEVSTGSLGHGLPVACGIAQALKMKKNARNRVYVVLGDGEHGEGSVWESAISAAHLKLGNLVAIIDNNGLQADGSLEEITGITDIGMIYRANGWNVIEIDGNEISEVMRAFDSLPSADSDTPTVIVCHTVKGKGISFMENNDTWHAGKVNDKEYAIAMSELRKAV